MRSEERRKIVQELQDYPAFSACAPEDLEELVGVADEFVLPATWSLLHEGIPADAIYVIREGTARVYDGREVVAELGPGDLVGEMAFIDGGQRRASVSTVTRVNGIRVDYRRLAKVVTRRPSVGEAIDRVYRSRVPERLAG